MKKEILWKICFAGFKCGADSDNGKLPRVSGKYGRRV